MNILLACAAGMLTSLLVTKMEKSAEEQGKDYKIGRFRRRGSESYR